MQSWYSNSMTSITVNGK
ncbi:hypothetical protein LINGRAHAP2_LOCUS9812 [Linum grandiflorum]